MGQNSVSWEVGQNSVSWEVGQNSVLDHRDNASMISYVTRIPHVWDRKEEQHIYGAVH